MRIDNIYRLFLYAIVIVTYTSCDKDFEEINSNPNEPEVVPSSTIFNSATKELMDVTRDEFASARTPLPWMQYWGQTSYADEDRYQYRESVASNYYRDLYLVAQDLRNIIKLNTDPETSQNASFVGNNNNEIAVCRIMLSYIFHQLVDAFGDIPYYSFGSDDSDFQALNVTEVLSPVFASQEKIYDDIISELQAASDMIDINDTMIDGDNIYRGDASKWKKFANSLLLRVANRLRNVDPVKANAAITTALSNGVFTSNEDNAGQAYDASDALSSPLYNAYFVSNRTDFAVASPLIELLKGNRGNFGLDPRLFQYAAPATASISGIGEGEYITAGDTPVTVTTGNPADYVGIPYAFPIVQQLPFASYSFPSLNILKQDYTEVLMEYAEVAFIISEHNNWSQTEYEIGIRASMERWGVPISDIDNFISTLPAASQETVLNQKYIALYMQPYEAWAEYRRTGFPSTLVLPNTSTNLDPTLIPQLPAGTPANYIFEPLVNIPDLPKRLRYPIILQTLNGQSYTAAIKKLEDGDTVSSSLFWDVN